MEELDLVNKKFWDHIALNFEATFEMIRQESERLGIDFDARKSEAKEIAEKTEPKESEVEKLTNKYSHRLLEWLQENSKKIKADIHQADKIGTGNLFTLENAWDIINWYSMFIHVKTKRAMMIHEFFEDDEDEYKYHDNLGTAIVALIAMDRSVEAFGILLPYIPEFEDDILWFLVALGKARNLLEKQWPKARNFIRPGLDE